MLDFLQNADLRFVLKLGKGSAHVKQLLMEVCSTCGDSEVHEPCVWTVPQLGVGCHCTPYSPTLQQITHHQRKFMIKACKQTLSVQADGCDVPCLQRLPLVSAIPG